MEAGCKHILKKKGFVPQNFVTNCGLIESSVFLLPFELLFGDRKQKDLCNKDMPLSKITLLHMNLTTFQNFSNNPATPEKLTPCEFDPIQVGLFRGCS